MALRDLFRRDKGAGDQHHRSASIPTGAQLADGGSVSVSNEEQYQDALRAALGGNEREIEVLSTLVVNDDGNPWSKKPGGPILEVRVGGSTVGFLTTAMTARYMPFADSAAAEGRPLTAKAWVVGGSGESGGKVGITLNAVPMWRGTNSIGGLKIDRTAEFVYEFSTRVAHKLESDSDGSWITKCGQQITPRDGEVIYRTKPWVGRVHADDTLADDRSPWWCSACVPSEADDAKRVEDGGRFGSHSTITHADRFSADLTPDAIREALATGLDFDCAGESFREGYPENLHRLADVLVTMQGGERLSCVLRRDPGNRYDENAIEVHVPGAAGHVGFVPAELASILAPMLDRGDTLTAAAIEVRVHPDRPDKPGLTVMLQRAERPPRG